MNLEDLIAAKNSKAFWNEFTFKNNKFKPAQGTELELADSLVLLGDYLIVLQLKERSEPTNDPIAEAAWFRNKVLKKGSKQVKDTLHYLKAHPTIKVENARGDVFEIKGDEICDLTKLIVFSGAAILPADIRDMKCHRSNTAGFIHLLAASDYLQILEILRVPDDIRKYFVYREEVLGKIIDHELKIFEADIVGAFLHDETLPTSNSHQHLRRFVQDLAAFDLSSLIGNLSDHVALSAEPRDYYQIMLEFARLPRSVWRAFKERFVMATDLIKAQDFSKPYLVASEKSGCAFMIATAPIEFSRGDKTSVDHRLKMLRVLTDNAMYVTRSSRGLGLMVSKDGEYFQLEWALIDLPWSYDEKMASAIAERSPFRSLRVAEMNSFLFVDDIT